MIKSKADYLYYLQADKAALKITRKYPKIIGDEIWKFEILLRKNEYYYNCKKHKNIFYLIHYYFLMYRLYKIKIKLGLSIPLNIFGPGLFITHYGNIVVNSHCVIGSNCVINVGVNIGINKGGVPKIGNNVYIGPGAKLFGDITLGDNVSIGANAVVNKSFPDNVTIVGVPAKVVSTKD